MQVTLRRDEKFDDRSVQFAAVAGLFLLTGLAGLLFAPAAVYEFNDALSFQALDPAAPATIPGHAILPLFLGVGNVAVPTHFGLPEHSKPIRKGARIDKTL